MLKGKQLYAAAREFVEDEVVPVMSATDLSDEASDELAEKGAMLGAALLIDIAESLHKIAIKIG